MPDLIVLEMPANTRSVALRSGSRYRIIVSCRGDASWIVHGLHGQLLPGAHYRLRLPDGSERAGVLDAASRIHERDLPAGPLQLSLEPIQETSLKLGWQPRRRCLRGPTIKLRARPELLDLQTTPLMLQAGREAWLCAHLQGAQDLVRFELLMPSAAAPLVLESQLQNGWARVRFTPSAAGTVQCKLRCGPRHWQRALQVLARRAR